MKDSSTLFNKRQSIDAKILRKDNSNISKVLLNEYSLHEAENISVLKASIEYVISTKRFDPPLYQN